MSALDGIVVTPVRAVAARRIAGAWDWAEANRDRIAAHWAGLTRANPLLYNGRVLVRRRQELSGDSLSLDYVETDYASFIAFRDFGFPDPTTGNGFAMAALRAGDGAWLLGRMGGHTANAGKIYFPAGTPDPDDAEVREQRHRVIDALRRRVDQAVVVHEDGLLVRAGPGRGDVRQQRQQDRQSADRRPSHARRW